MHIWFDLCSFISSTFVWYLAFPHWYHQSLLTNCWKQTGSREGGDSTPSVSDVKLPTMDTLRHPAQVWPGFDKKKPNFLPSANKSQSCPGAAFVCVWLLAVGLLSQQGPGKSKHNEKARHWRLYKFSWSANIEEGSFSRAKTENVSKSIFWMQFSIYLPVRMYTHTGEITKTINLL